MGTRTRICQKGWTVWVTFHVQPEDGHYQAPKHVVVPYVENTLYSTNKYSCVRPVHTLCISYCIEHNGDDEPHDTHTHIFFSCCFQKKKCWWCITSKFQPEEMLLSF